jgi:hypothetical protein
VARNSNDYVENLEKKEWAAGIKRTFHHPADLVAHPRASGPASITARGGRMRKRGRMLRSNK